MIRSSKFAFLTALLFMAFSPFFAHAASVTYSTGQDLNKIYGGNPLPTYASGTQKSWCSGTGPTYSDPPYTCYTGLDAWVDWNTGSYLGGGFSNNTWLRAMDARSFALGFVPKFSPNANVTYNGIVKNASGVVIPPTSTVTPGQKLTFIFPAYVPSDLTWTPPADPIFPGCTDSMTYLNATKNGTWKANAAAPPAVSCDLSDLYGYYQYASGGAPVGCSTINGGYSVFAPFMVNPPVRSMANMAGLSACTVLTTDGAGNTTQTCTVSATSGTITPTFSVGNTYGKFYFRAQRYAPMLGTLACRGNNRAEAVEGSTSDYKMTIPSQTIPYPLYIGPTGNQPPNAPVITGPNTTDDCSTNSYTFKATDPEGDTIRYGVDWDNDGVVDQWVPASGYVSSGTPGSASHLFSANPFAPITFEVLAQDSKNATSAWGHYSVTVNFGTCGITAVLTNNGPVASGSAAKLSWSCTGAPATSAAITNAVGKTPNGTVTPTTSGSTNTSALTANTTYTLTCTDYTGKKDTDITTVVVDAPLTIGSCKPSVATVPTNTNMSWSAVVSGGAGAGSYTYSWTSSGATPPSGSSATYTAKYAGAGPQTATLKVTSSDGQTKTTICNGLTVTPSTPPVTVSCSVSPVSGGTTDTYTWHALASGGSGGSYTYVWSGTNLTGKTGSNVSVTYGVGGTYTGSVTATDGSGHSSASTTCAPGGGGDPTGGPSTHVTPPPTATIYANGSASGVTINAGQSAKLTWSSTNATSCVAVGGFSTGGAANNAAGVSTGALADTTQYQVNCTGAGGSAYSNTVTITVIQPQATITANPVRVAKGDTSKLSWNGMLVTSCVVTGPSGQLQNNVADGSGNFIQKPPAPLSQVITKQSVYTITCQSATGPVTDSVTINVDGVIKQF